MIELQEKKGTQHSFFNNMLVLIHNIPGRPIKIPRALLAHWPVSLIPVAEPELENNSEILNRRADILLAKFLLDCPQAISFAVRIPFENTAAYRTQKSLHDQSLTISNIIDAIKDQRE